MTGLIISAGFCARVSEALALPESNVGTLALLFVDLDDFTAVNDRLGHAAGDELLRVVAARLSSVVRPGDLVARLGGDKFAILLDAIPDAGAACLLANRAIVAVVAPSEVLGQRVLTGASVGVSMRHANTDLKTFMREADEAMYSAKAHGKRRVELYDSTLHQAVVAHQSLRADIEHAADRDELVLHYQPVFDLTSGEVVGVEALVRWQHPTRGLLPPSDFIGMSENTGAIVEIGTWVLRAAAHQMHMWQRRYARPDLWLSVNVSVRQLEILTFGALVADVLSTTGLDPKTLILEVTESVLADPLGGVPAELKEVRRTGVRVALDDFGTGYCSIGYLQHLPVDVLKIDRLFVSGQEVRTSGRALLEGIVKFGQHLGLAVIPEGIERPEDLDRVQALGCNIGQGFLLSRPIRPDEIDEWLSSPMRVPPLAIAQLRLSHGEEVDRPGSDPDWAGALVPPQRISPVAGDN